MNNFSLVLIATLMFSASSGSFAQSTMMGSVKGFTEPYHSIDIATSESGTISEINVEEGQHVRANAILAKINEDVLQAALEVVLESVDSQGKLNTARAEMRMQQMRLQRIEGLFSRQHASQNEIDRARSQLEIAQAQVESAQDELRVKSKEAKKIEAQLEQRRLRTPIDGVVTQVFKDSGEFVSINEPTVLRVVQLDPLKVVFSIPRDDAKKLTAGATVDVEVGTRKDIATALVEFVSPTADAQSGTCRVKVRIDNPELRWPSGVECRLKSVEGQVVSEQGHKGKTLMQSAAKVGESKITSGR